MPHSSARAIVGLSLVLSAHSVCADGAAARIAVTIDVSPAAAVLAAATSDREHVAALADAALKLPAIQAMIAKEHRYIPAATADSFRAALVGLATGGDGKPFALASVRADSIKIGALLAELRTRRSELGARLSGRLQAYAPARTSLSATLSVVLGSHQNGWVPDQKSPVFYLDAGFQEGDVDALVAVAAHELYHVVQGAAQPDWGPALAPSTADVPAARETHNVHAALLNLVIEGMADLVGDPSAFPGLGTAIEQARREYRRNLARSAENFALFETILFRLARDGDAPLGSLLNIGFGGAWGQSGYYVGYDMARVIERYGGPERLRELVTATPEAFVLEYARISHAHSSDAQIEPLSQATVAAVEAASSSLPPAGVH